MKYILLLSFVLTANLAKMNAQPGPGGVGDLSGNSLLKLWVTSEFANVNTNNAPVDTLYDLSGANNHLVADSASIRPLLNTNQLNGYPSVSFNGVDQYLHDVAYDSSFYNDEATLIAIVSRQSQGTIVSVASTGVDEEFLMLSGKAFHHSSTFNYTNLDHDCNASDTLSPFCILTGEFGKTALDLSLYYNQVASTQNIQTNNAPIDYTQVNRLIYIGSRQQFLPSEYFNGGLVELIGYNRKLTNTERASVLNYLTNKYLLPVNCGTVSSINEIKDEYGIIVYPNPSNGSFVFESKINEGEIEIYTILGERIFSEHLSFTSKKEINLKNINAGIYFMKISYGKKYYTQKLIVNQR